MIAALLLTLCVQTDRSGWVLASEQAAKDCARRVIGYPDVVAATAEAELQRGGGDDVPFLWRELANRPLWRVKLSDWRITVPSQREVDRFARDVEIYLDPESGALLEFRSGWPIDEPPMSPIAKPLDAEQDMLNGAEERYLRFVTAEGPSLVEAIHSPYVRGHDVRISRQIIAHRVERSRLGQDGVRAVWAITARGVPFRKKGKYLGDDYQLRYLVDANDAKYIGYTNVPHADYHSGEVETQNVKSGEPK